MCKTQNEKAACVLSRGGLDFTGDRASYPESGVRPALWLNLQQLPEKYIR